MSLTTMEVPIDPALRKKAEKVLDELGLDINSIVRVFLKKVVATNSIPFALAEEPPRYRFTPVEEKEILRATKEARDPKKLSGPFHSADALISHLRQTKA